MLELLGITAGYERGAPVVRGASVTVAPGESVGLLGPSGCGKSTLARVAALLHRPDAGTVTIDGTRATGWRHRAPKARRTAIGVVFQQPRLAADPRLRLTDLIAEPCARAAGAPKCPTAWASWRGLSGSPTTCSAAGRTRSVTVSSNVPVSPARWCFARAG